MWVLLGVATITVLSGQHERASDVLAELCSTIKAKAGDHQHNDFDEDATVLLPLCIAAIYGLNHEPERAYSILQDVIRH
jgi:hypothetical protein